MCSEYDSSVTGTPRFLHTRRSRATANISHSSTICSSIIYLLLLVLCIVPLTSSLQTSSSKDVSIDSDVTNAAVTDVTKPSETDIETTENFPVAPRVLKLKGSRKTKCPKKYRQTFCMNKGKCRWIVDLEQPTCRCRKSWDGDRCHIPSIEFTQQEQDRTNVIIAVVLSAFGLVGALTAFCVCWRRYKFVREHNVAGEIETKKSILDQETNKTDSCSVTLVASDKQ